MSESMYHPTTPEQAKRRKGLAPGVHDAFQSFSKAVFADGALPESPARQSHFRVRPGRTTCAASSAAEARRRFRRGTTRPRLGTVRLVPRP